MYKSVVSVSAAIMPIGMSRPGLRASSAAVESESNPRYEKNSTAVPADTPDQPYGKNGVQFCGLICGPAKSRKRKIVPNLTKTSTRLAPALSRMPRSRKNKTTPTINMAGKFIRPPSAGTVVSIFGKWMPMSAKILVKYADQPPATALAPTVYSRISDQPTSQPKISPSETYA